MTSTWTTSPAPADITRLITVDSFDLQLFVCTDVLKLPSLHYGFWPPDAEPRWADLPAAQARFTEHLIAAIPDGVRSVLDVGCGVGDNARALSALGYVVTAISPDMNHRRYVDGDPRIVFERTRFEDFTSDRRFDLVLMSESQNYFDAAEGFRRTLGLLNPGGHLLVSGMFRRAGSTRFAQTRNDEREYVDVARREGLVLVSCADITPNVLPTLRLAREKYEDHVKPALDLVARYVSGTRSWEVRLLRLLLTRQTRRLARIRQYYEDYFDPALDERHVRYATLLFTSRAS
jgi:SAM-dependent methyltransferase